MEYATVLPGGKHWSFIARQGTHVTLTDQEGGGNVGMLFYNPTNLLERYNAPDTLKCQQTFRLTAGHCLYSDMGRIFCTVVGDSLGWHDTIGGTSLPEDVAEPHNYQEARNDWTQNGRDSFLVEGAKYGLGRRDLAANVNWFSKISVDHAGTMDFHPSHSSAGATIILRFEMDTLVLLHTCPHPMNPLPAPRSVAIAITAGDALAGSVSATHPENTRGMMNNRLYHQHPSDAGHLC